MSDPGRLKSRLVLQAPVETPDGQGGVVRSFASVTTMWAAVMQLSAREQTEADAHGSSVRVRIVVRGNFSITPQHRLVDGARVYRIASVRDFDEGRFQEIDAEWRIA